MATSPTSSPGIIGRQILIRGTLVGEEDLIVEGRIEGSVTLAGHLIVAESGVVHSNVDVDSIEIIGEVVGDIVAAQSITIRKGAQVQGSARSPRIIIDDGARFQGAVEMVVSLPDALTRSLPR